MTDRTCPAGVDAGVGANIGTDAGAVLSAEELARYARQMRLPGIGPEGQAKLRQARVLVVGAGGLGSPIALYLVAAGVGILGLADGDTVDTSNLHRQILYTEADVGAVKVAAAAARLRQLNHHAVIVPHSGWVRADTVLDLISGYDLVIDGTDTQASRYLLNDATAMLGLPLVAGAVDRFAGMLSVFNYRDGPCYRCLFPEPAAPGQVTACSEAGVVGPMPAVIGSLQALETLKLILGVGELLVGQVLSWDALANRFTRFKLAPDPDCPICSRPISERRLLVPDAGGGAVGDEGGDVGDGGPAGALGQALLVDVREDAEWHSGTLAGARHIPLGALAQRAGELPRDREVVLFCRSGQRSAVGAAMLARLGFTTVRSLPGGLMAWTGPVVVPSGADDFLR